ASPLFNCSPTAPINQAANQPTYHHRVTIAFDKKLSSACLSTVETKRGGTREGKQATTRNKEQRYGDSSLSLRPQRGLFSASSTAIPASIEDSKKREKGARNQGGDCHYLSCIRCQTLGKETVRVFADLVKSLFPASLNYQTGGCNILPSRRETVWVSTSIFAVLVGVGVYQSAWPTRGKQRPEDKRTPETRRLPFSIHLEEFVCRKIPLASPATVPDSAVFLLFLSPTAG
ncbi:hypothetical protein H113_00923, partial [Trichophyton rubrum MR1459]